MLHKKCKYCGEKICNGVGPSGLPTITTILNKTPSGHLFFECACMHDEEYHLQIGRHLADINFLHRMRAVVHEKYPEHKGRWFDWINPNNGRKFAQRNYFLWRANRMFWWVDKFGEKAYKEGACKELPVG